MSTCITGFIMALVLMNTLIMTQAERYPSLVLIRNENQYELAKPIQMDNEDQSVYNRYPYGYTEKLFFACPVNDGRETVEDINPLYLQETKTKDDRSRENLTCEFPIRSTIEEDDEEEYMEELQNFNLKRYRVGFKIYKVKKIVKQESDQSGSNLSKDNKDYQFIKLTDITFDRKTSSVRFVSYNFIKSPAFFSNEPVIPWYKNKTIFLKDIDHFYKIQSQKQAFKEILGKQQGENVSQNYGLLIKQPLTSHYDFNVHMWEHVIYQDANTAPMWQQLEHDWTMLEKLTRDVADLLDKVHIETGTGKPLNIDGYDMYLDNREGKIPIPELFWKVIINISPRGKFQQQGVILVMHNLPNHPKQKPVCDDVSETIKWPPDYTVNVTGKAYIYSCNLNQQNAENVGIPFPDEFRNAAPFNLENVSIIEDGQMKTLNLYKKFKDEDETYHYYHVKDHSLDNL